MSDPTPAENEASESDMVTIQFDEHDYKIPADTVSMDINVIREFEAGHSIAAVEGVFGPAQFRMLEQRVRKANDGRFPMRVFDQLAQKIAKHFGFESTGE